MPVIRTITWKTVLVSTVLFMPVLFGIHCILDRGLIEPWISISDFIKKVVAESNNLILTQNHNNTILNI